MDKENIHLRESVFTPSQKAKLTFVERVALNTRLLKALRTPGMQIVVYGPPRSGKSTLLLNKLWQTYGNHITTRCTTQMTFEQIVLNAFDDLEIYYDVEKVQSQSNKIS